MSTTPPPGIVHEHAERTVEYVRKGMGVLLDYAPETLPLLDHYLRSVPRTHEATIRLVAVTAGAYFGEVLRRTWGGEWLALDDKAAHLWRLRLAGGLELSPIGMALGATVGAEGPGDTADWDDSFEVPPASRARVEAALEGAGAVPEDEYYTLSGRYEALHLVIDTLIAAQN